jgi:hypothetical protein
MKRVGLFLVVSTFIIGCAFPDPNAPTQGEGRQAHPSVSRAEQADIRARFQQKYTEDETRADEKVDELEKKALKAIRMSIGKQAWGPGQDPPESSSVAIRKLRAAKIKVRLTPITDEDGKAIDDNFLQLTDSYSERLTQQNRKIVEQRLSKAEMREIQQGSKSVLSVNDLRQPVMSLSLIAFEANMEVPSLHLMQMLDVAGTVRGLKFAGMTLDAADYAHFKKGLTRLKRVEAIAAATLALLATYQAVLNDGGDPKALDVVAEGALKAFPLKVEATDAEARAYAKDLTANIAKVRGRYEGWMRKAYGDAAYEKKYKAQMEPLFQYAESSQTQKSVFEMQHQSAEPEPAPVRAKQAEPAPRDLSANGVDRASRRFARVTRKARSTPRSRSFPCRA